MKTLTSFLLFVALLSFAAPGLAELVTWEPCSPPNPNVAPTCTIHEVRVDPCREGPSGKPCRARRGRNASISFDFTPNFSGGGLQSLAYWKNNLVEISLADMDRDACKATTCPVTAGTRQTYSYTLGVSRTYPKRIYDVMWRLWNAEEQDCCFMFQIRITN